MAVDRQNVAAEARPYESYAPLFREMHDLGVTDTRRVTLRNELVLGHLPVAKNIARRHRWRGAEQAADLEQVAFMSLVLAVDRYQPDYGNDFVPFAIPTISGEILRHLRDREWAVRVPRGLKDLRRKIDRTVEPLTQELGRLPAPGELARRLAADPDEVRRSISVHLAFAPESLDRQPEAGSYASGPVQLDRDLGRVDDRDQACRLLAHLCPRDRRIVLRYFVHGAKQREIGEEAGLSQMQIWRILRQSLEVMRSAAARPDSAATGARDFTTSSRYSSRRCRATSSIPGSDTTPSHEEWLSTRSWPLHGPPNTPASATALVCNSELMGPPIDHHQTCRTPRVSRSTRIRDTSDLETPESAPKA
jgi:RNA polymerase sigma-B factor